MELKHTLITNELKGLEVAQQDKQKSLELRKAKGTLNTTSGRREAHELKQIEDRITELKGKDKPESTK